MQPFLSLSVLPLFTFAFSLSLVYFPCCVVFCFLPLLDLLFHFPPKDGSTDTQHYYLAVETGM